MAKKKVVCLFCGKSHRVRPRLCQAKDKVMNSLIKTAPAWRVMRDIENGVIDLDYAAQKYLKPIRRKKAKSKRSTK